MIPIYRKLTVYIPPSASWLRKHISKNRTYNFIEAVLLFNLNLKLGCLYQGFKNYKWVTCFENYQSTTRAHVQVVQIFLYRYHFLCIGPLEIPFIVLIHWEIQNTRQINLFTLQLQVNSYSYINIANLCCTSHQLHYGYENL